jgi:AraC-like DNA-binding protein
VKPKPQAKPGLHEALSFASPRHALLAPVVANSFQVLDVGISIDAPGDWYDIYARPFELDLLSFELEHGVEVERVEYNRRHLTQARRLGSTVVAHYRGFTDLFVPIVTPRGADTVLVTGPFATSRPTGRDVQRRWRALAGRPGHPGDPEFAHYLAATLSTLALEGTRAAAFQKLVESLAQLMTPEGDAQSLIREVHTLRKDLALARFAERMWNVARAMVDEKTSRAWTSPHCAVRLRALGIDSYPEHVVVGLFVNMKRDSDPVDELIRRDAFQRACVGLGQASHAASGKIGGHGVTFLCRGQSSEPRTRRHLEDLTLEAESLARRQFGLGMHFGLSTLPGPLTEQYQSALAAAESAVSKNIRVVDASDALPAENPLGALRRELGERIEESPETLPARFDRYIEAVAARCGYRLDPAAAHLEAGFERIVESFRDGGAIDAKSLRALMTGLERAAVEARTVSELFTAYRRAVNDVAQAVRQPKGARGDHGLRRAEEYVRRHYAEPLGLDRVARVAGYAPKYFSVLFKQKQRMTFESYLTNLRIERAKQLLSGTTLNLERVARLSGFATRTYLGRVFKRRVGVTPIAFRRRVRKGFAA